MAFTEQWAQNWNQSNEVPNNEETYQEREQTELREQKNLEIMEKLKTTPEYEGALSSWTLKNGEEVLVFDRAYYINSFENPMADSWGKTGRLMEKNHTINTDPNPLLESDDSIHIFSKYGLTTLLGIQYQPGGGVNTRDLERFEDKFLPIIQNLRTDGDSRLNKARPVNFQNLEHLSKVRMTNKSENNRLFATFHIFNGLSGDVNDSSLHLLGKRLEEASKERKKRDEAINWAEVEARNEEARKAREEKERMKTPEGILERMRGGKTESPLL